MNSRHLRSVTAAALIALAASALRGAAPAGPVDFVAHDVDASFRSGYEKGGKWDRRVIFDKVSGGHEVAVIDLNGDGRDDVIANDNGRVTPQNPNATPGVHVFFAPADPATGEWQYRRIEDKAAMNSCVAADVNGDHRPDLVCTGAGGAIRWYENKGLARSSTAGGRYL